MNLSLLAQGTGFTYQGRLQEAGSPANGNYDFRFRIASDALGNNYVGSPFLTNAVPVSNGLFTVTLDFGAGIFTGPSYWLQVDVRTNGAGGYTALSPLQPLTPTPYAVMANSASNLLGTLPAAQLSGALPSSQLAGTYSSAVTLNNAGNSFSGSGAALTGLNASQLTSGTVPDARLSANVALRSGGNSFTGNQVVTSGNLGIGTNSPQAPLHVANATTSPEALFSNTVDAPASLAFGTTFRTWRIGQNRTPDAPTAADAFFVYDQTAAKTRMLIDTLGNVGIGKANPATALDVNGTVTATAFAANSFTGNGSGLTNLSSDPLVVTPQTNMVWIRPGSFAMGSPSFEVDRQSNEGPQMSVTISWGFWMGAREVAQGEYLSLMNTNPSFFTGDLTRPVEQVSWNDATNYCATLTQWERTAGRIPANWAYRLPTEAEWEYAARAGTLTRFYYGDDSGYTGLDNYAWYPGNSSSTTHPVAEKAPNAWGLYDMAGNVWEWCQDWAGTYPGGSLINPQGPSSGSNRVFRGGGWADSALNCRSARRFNQNPANSYRTRGFRVVLAPVQP
jgi:formylglycine-generating enzyme required for sulfatase activity